MYASMVQINPLSRESEEIKRQTTDGIRSLQQERDKREQYQDDALRRLGIEYNKDMKDIIGTKYLERYYSFQSSLQQRLRDVADKAEPTEVGDRRIQEARDQAEEESRAFLREIGFDIARASKMGEEYQTRANAVLSGAATPPAERNYLMPPQVAESPDLYIHYYPPYFTHAWHHDFTKKGNNVTGWAGVDPYVGNINGVLGSMTYTGVNNADEYNWAKVVANRTNYVLYTPPVAGKIEALMKLRCVFGVGSSGIMHWEFFFNFHTAVCHQKSRATLSVGLDQFEPADEVSLFGYSRNALHRLVDWSWSRTVSEPNDVRWVQLVSADSYSTSPKILGLGTEDRNSFWCNKFHVESWMFTHWRLEEVCVRTVS